MSHNALLASTVINTARELGVENFVICAGARNVPLIADLTTREDIQLWNHFDERSAAFFALGLAKSKNRPVAVVTTSGTAVAELFPAVIESWYAGIQLVLITADRPVKYRGSGAPQAIEQAGIFYGYVSQFLDLEYRAEPYEAITWDQQSPLHLNACFEEPTAEPAQSAAPLPNKIEPRQKSEQPIAIFPSFENPVAIIGELQQSERAAVVTFLKQTGIPTWFEATSGLREHIELTKNRINWEADIPKLQPKEIIRIGGVPSLRYWRDLESEESIKVLNYTRTGFSGLARNQNVITTNSISELPNIDSILSSPSFNTIESPIQYYQVDQKLEKHPESEPSLIKKLSELIPGEAAVFLGNSLPIREWNLAASHDNPHPHCYANRGANGIDGEVSTYLGISENYTESWGIFGDLTSLYDLNAPWILNQLPDGKRRIVVLNNGGGRIFSRLPAMNQLDTEAMGRTENQHQIQFSAWAELWSIEYLHWQGDPSRWNLPETDSAIIEIKIDQSKSEAFWADLST